ncbi:MAG TPA: sulfite oxidase [Burkholderiales bacterium]|nr:sulfite oxidase [Burkholderiales bacterium]
MNNADNAARGSRRDFLGALAGMGASAAVGAALPSAAWGQAAPKPPAQPAGTVSNEAVLAGKDAALKPHSDRPLTASATAEYLGDDVTPTSRHFVRNNLFTPDFDEAKHTVEIAGLVDKPMTLTLAELRARFPEVSTQAMIECAGSGRTGFSPLPRGTPWPASGGMSCSQWTGVRLGDVLRAAGIRSGAVHVAFTGADFGALPTIPKVARSVPVEKAMERHTLLAYGMNGASLPKIHGYPMRLVVPSWAGSASVKWVARIEVLAAPLKGPYMDESYRIPRTPVEPGGRMPADAAMTEGWPVKSIITHPAPNARVSPGKPLLVAGHAWAGEHDISRVELSFDEGRSWRRAELNPAGDKYAWRTFSLAYTPPRAGYTTVLARATDDAGNSQPALAAWNPLGYFWNGWHRIGFVVAA